MQNGSFNVFWDNQQIRLSRTFIIVASVCA